MKVKKARVMIVFLTIAFAIIIIGYLASGSENGIVQASLKNELVKTFAEEHDEYYNITYLSREDVLILKNSPQYAFYVDLPEKPLYRVLVLEEGNGYMLFLDAESMEVLKIMGAHNLNLI